MAGQDFAALQAARLLTEVEAIVVQAHRRLHARDGRPWTPADAYRWLRYEDPDPAARLLDGVRRLRRRGVRLDAEAVEKACSEASKLGYLN